MNSERLKQLRHENVMTQKELAEAAKVGVRTLSALENGETTAQPRTIRKLAEVLGVEPKDLIAEAS